MSATPSVPSSPLALDDSRPIEELGVALRAAGLTGEGVRTVLGSAGELLSRSVDIPLHERRLEGVEPLGTLVELLVLDAPARVDEARRAFAPLTLERTRGARHPRGGRWARASVDPHRAARRDPDRIRPQAPHRRDDAAGSRRRGTRTLADALTPDGAATGRVCARRRGPDRASRQSLRPATASVSSRPTSTRGHSTSRHSTRG